MQARFHLRPRHLRTQPDPEQRFAMFVMLPRRCERLRETSKMRKRGVTEILWESGRPLFATVDCARGQDIQMVLPAQGAKVTCLYEGKSAQQLRDVAPHILAVGENSPFLERLVRGGWGRSSEVFFSSDSQLEDIRRHFRKFL